jgi:hypothetical protein
MRWFRANARLGGGMALFALALQFALSFGHIHPEDIYGPGGAPTQVAAATVPATVQPADTGSTTHDDDYCAICATMALLNNSFVAAPPQLPTPQVLSRAVEHADSVAVLVIAPRRAPFQSRAPPAA